MDTRTGHIYESRELARAAGVPDEFLVSGTEQELKRLRRAIVFSKGSFKSLPAGQREQVDANA